jgi:hypothetical protein
MKKQCKNCGKKLNDEVSLKRGFGPECWNKQKAKGTLPILITLATGVEKLDYELFNQRLPGGESCDFVIAINAQDIFPATYNSGYATGGLDVEDKINSEWKGPRDFYAWMVDQIVTTHVMGSCEIVLYGRKTQIPENILPELPPNMMGKKSEALTDFEETWEPLLMWNSKRIELMSLKAKAWEMKNEMVRLVKETVFNTGTMFIDDGYEEEELLWEKNMYEYGTDDWYPTNEFGNWIEGDKNRFWKENPHFSFLKRKIESTNVVLKVSDDMMDIIIGDRWQESHKAQMIEWAEHERYARDMAIHDTSDFLEAELPIEEWEKDWYENPYRWLNRDYIWMEHSWDDLSMEDQEELRMASLFSFSSDLTAIWAELEMTRDASKDAWEGPIEKYRSETEDSIITQSIKIGLWRKFSGDLQKTLESQEQANRDTEYMEWWDDDTGNERNLMSVLVNNEGDPYNNEGYDIMAQNHVKSALKRIIKESLTLIEKSILKMDIEIFEFDDYN